MDIQATSPDADALRDDTLQNRNAMAQVPQWQAFRRFVAEPFLPEQASGITRPAINATVRLFGIDIAFMAVLIGIAMLAMAAGFEAPVNVMDDMKITAGIVFAIVVFAPVVEELVFRSWLSGRRAHVFVPLVLALTIGGGVGANLMGASLLIVIAFAIGGLSIAIWLLIKFSRGGPMPWFRAGFRWIYYASAALFACVHLLNYEGSDPVLLLFVLPQFVAGLIFGFARVQYGLWSSIALHVVHNALFITIALLGEGAA